MGARSGDSRDALASWGSAVLLGGFVEGWVALVGLSMMAVGAPWPRARSQRRRREIERSLAERYPRHRWFWEEEGLLHGLPPPDEPFSAVWAVPLPRQREGFELTMGGAAPPPRRRAGLGLALGTPPIPTRLEGHHEGLGRIAVGGRLTALAPRDRLWLGPRALVLETRRPAGASRWGPWLADTAARLLGREAGTRRDAVAWLRATDDPVLRQAALLGWPDIFERRPDPDSLVTSLGQLALDPDAPRGTRLRAARLLAGRIPVDEVLEILRRLVFLEGQRPDQEPQLRLLRMLDARDLDAQVAAVRALEGVGTARALPSLGRLSPADPARAAELVDAAAHARAAIRARSSAPPGQGSLAVLPEGRGGLGLPQLPEGALGLSRCE